MVYASSTTDRRRAGGFTLAETLMAATVLAATVVAIMAPISASYKQTQSMQEVSTASSLARQLLDEITAKPFLDPQTFTASLGPDAGEIGRAAFDDIGDYHGYTDTTSALKEADGASVTWSGATVFRRSVSVEFRSAPDGPATTSGDFALVTVSVSSPDGQIVQAQRLVSNYPRLLLKSTP